MPDLGTQAIRRWCRNLPPDVREIVTDDVGGDDPRIQAMVDRLTAAPLSQAAAIIREHDRLVAGMGRPRRVRLMAWLGGRISDDAHVRDFAAIFDEGEDDGSQGGGERPVSCRVLYEDLRLLAVNVIAARQAPHAIDPVSIDLVTRSSLAAAPETGFSGGMQ
jgi:hypothetical protein